MNFETKCVHANNKVLHSKNSVTMPIYQTTTFHRPSINSGSGYDYGRLQNPTREAVEVAVANLEESKYGFGFSSGMSAIAICMELFSSEDHIIASDDLYGGSVRLFTQILNNRGIKVDFANTCNATEVKNLINKNTKAIFIETPTNPTMKVTDIRAMADLKEGKNILLIVDNTFLSPFFQKPINLGADIVIHSGTKYLGGHNDALAGFLVTNSDIIAEKVSFFAKSIGSCLAPLDSYLILRGIKTLAIRMKKCQENAKAICAYLEKNSKVKKVYYIGQKDREDFFISSKQSTGFGGMISFEVESKELALKILEGVKLIKFAESLGSVETLITYPITQTHAEVPLSQLEERGINERFLRLSCGIENSKDLINDLDMAFRR